MKSRKTPNPAKYKSSLNAKLHTDAQVVKWVQRLTGDPKARPSQMDELRLEFVMREVLALRGEQVDETLFHKAMVETCPILAAPDWTNHAEDITHVFSQPEANAFWHTWQPEQGATGKRVDYFAAKAVLCVLAMCGATAQFDDAIAMLEDNPKLREAFENLEGRPLRIPPYSSLMRQIHHAAKAMRPLVMAANIAMVKELAELFPNQGFGENLAIDTMAFAAWVPQRGSRDPEKDVQIGRRIPEAGYRMYAHSGKGKKNVGLADEVKGSEIAKTKDWRGFHVAAIIDIASGLPLVWITISNKVDEAKAIIPLLSALYRLWPDCPAKTIAGDSAWDEDPWCRLCEVDYGIAPVFRLHETQREQTKWDVLDDGSPKKKRIARDGQIWAITGKGQLICGCHQKPLKFAGFDRAKRVKANGQPLLIGQSSDERHFAVRGLCDHDTIDTRLSLKAMTDWSRLTRFPHHPFGDPKKYAKRQALLTRLNRVESLWNRLKSGGLGVQGADRMRTLPMDTIDTVVSLAMLGFTGLATADQRQRRQIGPYTPAAAPGIVVPNAVQRGTTVPSPTPAPAPVQVPVAASAITPSTKPKTKKPAGTVVATAHGRVVKIGGRLLPPSRIAQLQNSRR